MNPLRIHPPLDCLQQAIESKEARGGKGWKWGYRVHPKTGEQDSYHDGVDLGAGVGEPIRAIADGVVGGMGEADHGGKWIRILHGLSIHPIAQSGHCHCDGFVQGLRIGDEVKAGQVIAYVGFTGGCEPPGPPGAHLHFQLWVRSRDGKMHDVDPLPLLKASIIESQTPPIGGIGG